jgi:hypothetical protein
MTRIHLKLILFLIPIISLTAFAGNDEIPAQTSLPLMFNTGNPAPYGLPSTVISVEGKSLPVIFDTGAKKSGITLSAHALKGLHVRFTGNQTCFNAFDGKHCEKEFIIPEVKIGAFVLKNIKATLMPKLWGGKDTGFLATEASKNGVIGYNLLSQFNILLDYPHKKAILYRKGQHPAQYDFLRWIVIPFSGQLYTTVQINGKNMILGWDTGSVPSVIKADVVKNMQLSKCPANTPFGKSKNCQQLVTQTFTTAEGVKLTKTGFLIEDIPAIAPFDGLVGSNFYMQNLVYFDFDNQKIYSKHWQKLRYLSLNFCTDHA